MFVDVGILQLVPVARMLKVVEEDLSVEALHHLAGNCIRSASEGTRLRLPCSATTASGEPRRPRRSTSPKRREG